MLDRRLKTAGPRYEQAARGLEGVGEKVAKALQRVGRELKSLEPEVEALAHGSGAPTPEQARAALRYLELLEEEFTLREAQGYSRASAFAPADNKGGRGAERPERET